MDPNNTTDQECYEVFTSPPYVALIIFKSIVSSISFVCLLLVILFIFLFKKHHFFTQRLILYLAFSSLFFSVEGIMNVVGSEVNSTSSLMRYCVFTGFLDQVTSWWMIMAIFFIMLDIIIKIVTFKNTEKLEWGYVTFIFVLPLVLTSWIPFIKNSYGPAGPVCWIRSKNLTDCSKFGFGIALQFTTFFIPVFALMAITLILFVASILLLRKKSKSWAGKYDHHSAQLKTKMQMEVRPLFIYPAIIICANILPCINRVYQIISPEDQQVWLWYCSQLTYKLQGVFITLAFIMDKETRRKLTLAEINAALRRLLLKEDNIHEYPVHEGDTDDAPESFTEIQGNETDYVRISE